MNSDRKTLYLDFEELRHFGLDIIAVKEGKALRLAEELDIPFRDDLLKCLEKDFDHNYSSCGYLMDSPDYVEPTLQLFRKTCLFQIWKASRKIILDLVKSIAHTISFNSYCRSLAPILFSYGNGIHDCRFK